MDYNRKDVSLFHDSQSIKDCKKQTPDYMQGNKKKGKPQVGFRVGDEIYVKGKSLVNKKKLNGVFIFDSYDSYDNSCYVSDRSLMTYNVTLNDLIKFK